MRSARLLGGCLVMALLAPACSRQTVTDGDDNKGKMGENLAASPEDYSQLPPSIIDQIKPSKNANIVLAYALAVAASDDKHVLVHLAAPG